MNCPCGSQQTFEACCAPFLSGDAKPKTAEALMRSRYTAYTKANIPYIRNTLAPESSSDFDSAAAKTWAQNSEWKGLKIVSTSKGTAEDDTGVVEFVATFSHNGETLDHHEVAKFRKNKHGQWLFVSGDAHTHKEGESHHHEKIETQVRAEPKIGRNDPCTCGSGKKYKKCCGVAA
jgi:SEC-C motif-containing protein